VAPSAMFWKFSRTYLTGPTLAGSGFLDLQPFEPFTQGYGFAHPEVLAGTVLVPLGSELQQGVVQPVDDVDGDGFPAQPLGGFEPSLSRDQGVIGTDHDGVK